jgi:hypothetical protein
MLCIDGVAVCKIYMHLAIAVGNGFFLFAVYQKLATDILQQIFIGMCKSNCITTCFFGLSS